MFVACGHNGQRVVSDDGVHWRNQVFGKDGETYQAVTFGGGHVVCVGRYGGQNIWASSANGVDWEMSNNDAKYKYYLQGVAYGNGGFLALGGDPVTVGVSVPFVMTSHDGLKWSDMKPTGGKTVLRRAAWGNGRWVGVGDRGRRAGSPDGVTWEETPNVKSIDTLVDVAFGNGVFVGVGLHGLRMSTKSGAFWENRQSGLEGEHLNSIVWADDRFVAVGQGATWFSQDGANWERKENQNAPLCAAYNKGVFVGAHWKGRVLYSQDALVWKEVFKSDEHLEAVTAAS